MDHSHTERLTIFFSAVFAAAAGFTYWLIFHLARRLAVPDSFPPPDREKRRNA